MGIQGKFASLALATLLLAACGGGPSGTYEGVMGSTITFSSGKADISLAGNTMEVGYSVDGNKIKLHGPGGGPDLVLTLHSDGTLDTPWGDMKKK